MQEEKSVVYTIVLGVCMLICLLLMGKMLLGHAETGTVPPVEREDTEVEFHISEDEMASVLKQALPIPIEELTVKISKEGTIAVAAAVNRQILTDSDLVPGKWRTALLFLPEQCRLYGEWSAALENGTLCLNSRILTLEGIALPEQAAQMISDALVSQWRAVMQEQGITPQALQWEDGGLTVKMNR